EDPPAPRYQTGRSLCGLQQDVPIDEIELAANEDEQAATLLPALSQLDPRYLCGDLADPSATGMMIRDLENGEPYSVLLVAVDRAGNARGVFFSQTITPQPATDFWEDLHDRGSNVEGGFCLLAETYG